MTRPLALDFTGCNNNCDWGFSSHYAEWKSWMHLKSTSWTIWLENMCMHLKSTSWSIWLEKMNCCETLVHMETGMVETALVKIHLNKTEWKKKH